MANPCLQLSGFLISCLGWVGIVIATATNDWVTTCKYGMNTCKKMDELGALGPWADCVISTALYHCVSLTQILDLPAYIQTTRALMITGSILGLPAVGLVLMSMPCISLGSEPQSSKNQRSILGGVLILLHCVVWCPQFGSPSEPIRSTASCPLASPSTPAGWAPPSPCWEARSSSAAPQSPPPLTPTRTIIASITLNRGFPANRPAPRPTTLRAPMSETGEI
ncbi:claudin-11a isoform 1-T1 [Polymixia lowei]